MRHRLSCPLFGATVRVSGLLFVLVYSVSPALAQSNSPADDVLTTLRKGHPRLYILDSELRRTQEAMAQDLMVKGWYDDLRSNLLLTIKPVSDSV